MDTRWDWNCIDKILPYPIIKANGTANGVTRSHWIARSDGGTTWATRQRMMGYNLSFKQINIYT